MNISVVMATYNGEKFIRKQLDSIRMQTRLPDEVLIFDDISTDRTKEIVDSYIKEFELQESWHFHTNETNKGCIRNFLDGAQAAHGDIIFYADQDDIWALNKIELMEEGFFNYPDMIACYCLRYFIDTNDNEIVLKHQNMTNVKVRTSGFQKLSIAEAVRFNKSPGLCLAIKKELITETREMILDNGLTHDLPIGTVAAIHNGYYVLNQKLVYYRQHGNNVSAARYDFKSRLTKKDKQIEGRIGRLIQMEAIFNKYHSELSEKDSKNLTRAIISTRKSIEHLKNRKIIKLFFSMFGCNPMMNRWIAVNNFLISIRR